VNLSIPPSPVSYAGIVDEGLEGFF